MPKRENVVLLFLFLLFMSPFFACVIAIPNRVTLSAIPNNPIKVQTWNSEFHDVSCVSDFPPFPNNDLSWMGRIAIDSQDVLHVVWSENTDNLTGWGTDAEIFYSYFNGTSWSTPIPISHWAGLNGTSEQPSIAIDTHDNVHVIWSDDTPGWWQTGSESEIFYAMKNAITGFWSIPVAISDDLTNWNTGLSKFPFLAIDSNDNLHVVWQDQTSGQPWGGGPSDTEILYINRIGGTWGSIIPISDDITDFNKDLSGFPSIAADCNDNLHVVWQDDQDNISIWGADQEILYRNYTVTSGGWNSIIGLSGVGLNAWNNDISEFPIIATNPNTGSMHVVWQDDTNGTWGADYEIFYSNSTNGAVWSNATALSGIGTNYWNNDNSFSPWIIIDNLNVIHVVWHDDTDALNEWGIDRDIFYSNSTNGATWLNATCLSDQPDYTYSNNGDSEEPCIAYDSTNFVHIVWWDNSPAYPWSPPFFDYDIVYTSDYLAVGTPLLHAITPNPSTDGVIHLNWTSAANAAYYKIYRSTSNLTISGLAGLNPIGTTRSTTYFDNLNTDGTYYYVIVAHNVGGNGPASNCESVIVSIQKPPFPWWIIMIILIVIFLVLALYLYNRHRKNKKLKA